MTDSLPDPELDELVAAYLDGEATPDERARVQNDPVLLARAEQLHAVSRMVAEPVVPPDAARRDAHIAAALEASSTSPVVTSLPSGRNRPEMLRIASIAAVVLAILVAVPLLLSNGGDDDDLATGDATSADDGLAAMDSVAAEGSDGAAEMAADEEPRIRSTDERDAAADIAAADDGAEMVAPAPTEDEAAAVAEEAPAGDDAESGPADVEATLADVARIDIDAARSPEALRRQVERRLSDESGTDEPPATDLVCATAIVEEISSRGPAASVGTTNLDDVSSEYVIIFEPVSVLFVFDAETCAVTFAD